MRVVGEKRIEEKQGGGKRGEIERRDSEEHKEERKAVSTDERSD